MPDGELLKRLILIAFVIYVAYFADPNGDPRHTKHIMIAVGLALIGWISTWSTP